MRTNLNEQDQVIPVETIQWVPYALAGFEGEYMATIINTNLHKAPFIALLQMKPDARIVKHYHPKLIESVYVVDGEMINEGSQVLKAGSFLVHGPGVLHGSHETKTGCTLMFIQYPTELPENGNYLVGPDDSVFAE